MARQSDAQPRRGYDTGGSWLSRGWVTGGHRQERLKLEGEGCTTLRADYRYSEDPVTKQHTEEQDLVGGLLGVMYQNIMNGQVTGSIKMRSRGHTE